MSEQGGTDTYIKCSKCKCKYINDDEHINTYFGFTRLNERYKTCINCRRRRAGVTTAVNVDDLCFSVTDHTDDNFVHVTDQLSDNEPISKRFSYSKKGKSKAQTSVVDYVNDLRRKWCLPPAFTSWCAVPVHIVTNKIEPNNVRFRCVDEPVQGRLKVTYNVNGEQPKIKRFRYTRSGIDDTKKEISDFMNKLRVDNGLGKVDVSWNGLQFTFNDESSNHHN